MDRQSSLQTAYILVILLGITNLNAEPLTAEEQLGKHLFFDTNLSSPAGQSCASCHDPINSYSGPFTTLPVSEGVIPGRFGNRNAPSIAYATYTPEFTLKRGIRGGQFRDGRALNLIEQAKQPFLDPLKMNNTSPGEVIGKVQYSNYADQFEAICGPEAFMPQNINSSYECMAASIAAFEGSSEINIFRTRFDRVMAGIEDFSKTEKLGYKLFTGKANCAHCHSIDSSESKPALFTNFRYYNIGVPQNTSYPFDLQNPIPLDRGLGGFLNNPKHNGKFKTPHLRDLPSTSPYMHNGVFNTLREVVHFYNKRDVDHIYPFTYPEFSENMERELIGNLGLTEEEENALVSFLFTLENNEICTADCAEEFTPK